MASSWPVLRAAALKRVSPKAAAPVMVSEFTMLAPSDVKEDVIWSSLPSMEAEHWLMPVAMAAPGSSNANPSALALVDSKPTVLLQHYDPEWARTLDHKTSRPRPLRYTGYAVRNPH